MTHLICNFDKEAESLGGLEEQPASDVLAEVLGLGARLHLEGLVRRGNCLALAGPLCSKILSIICFANSTLA